MLVSGFVVGANYLSWLLHCDTVEEQCLWIGAGL
jgi:hypothetical protein